MTFSDGTPFNAAAVAFNFKRDLASAVGDKPKWPVSSVTTSGNYDVVDPPDAAVRADHQHVPRLQRQLDRVADRAEKMGENTFKLAPVGAGPFTVVSDTVSSELVLKKNPRYWAAGQPYLDTLTFKSVASDEAALETMQAGGVQGYEGMQTPQLVSAFGQQFNVLDVPSTSPYVIQLNTAHRAVQQPERARGRVLRDRRDADRPEAVRQPAPGHRGVHGPERAVLRAERARLPDLRPGQGQGRGEGGRRVTVDLMATQSSVTQTVLEALQTMWQAAGMKVTIHVDQLANVIQQFQGKKWQASLQTAGAFDPAAGLGVNFRFGSKSIFSGVHDPKLDKLFAQATSTLDDAPSGSRCTTRRRSTSARTPTRRSCSRSTAGTSRRRTCLGPG